MVKQRSPNFPGVDLVEAVGLVGKIYTREKRAPFPAESAAAAWEYKGASGPVRVRIGALRQYGLLAKDGKNSTLTNRALTLVLRNPASKEYQEGMRVSALTPSLFREIQETRAEASDESLTHYLIVDRGFTPDGAARFIKAFRGTMNAAGLTENDIMSGLEGDEIQEEEEPEMPPLPPARDAITIPVPFGSERLGTVTLPLGMTEQDWERFDRILKGYRPEKEKRPSEEHPTAETSHP